MAATKAEQGNVGESLEDDESKGTKVDKENISKLYICNICGNSFMYEEGLFDHVSNNLKNNTISNIQLNDLNSLNQQFFVKHWLKLFKCEICEKYIKTEVYLASLETTINNKLWAQCSRITKPPPTVHWM